MVKQKSIKEIMRTSICLLYQLQRLSSNPFLFVGDYNNFISRTKTLKSMVKPTFCVEKVEKVQSSSVTVSPVTRVTVVPVNGNFKGLM